MPELECRHFSGHKPCSRNLACDRLQCSSYSPVQTRLLIIHLGAMGAVLRSTAIVPSVHRKYPGAHVTWVTQSPAHALLRGVPGIDRVITIAMSMSSANLEGLLQLAASEFDVALVIDKSLEASGLLRFCRVKEIKGFVADFTSGRAGAIVPANPEAVELWHLGLSDQKKFFENRKSEQQLLCEALDLGDYRRDEYSVCLSDEEKSLAADRRRQWAAAEAGCIVGLNTGCSGVLPHKKLSVEGHRRLIESLRGDSRFRRCSLVLLGGPEDTERNTQIASGLGGVIPSPTQNGLRDGLASVEACDIVFTGDSLGMHMAIGLKKWVVAWFGPSCPQEIDLYGRGRKIQSRVTCSPCWKRVCQKSVMCYDRVDFEQVADALDEGLKWLTLSSKPRFPETSSSLSP